MEDLTFGEQVKVVLSRKGMTKMCIRDRGYTKEIMEQALEIVKRNIPNAKLRGV